MIKCRYALFIGVCVKTEFNISIICLGDSFWSDVAIWNNAIVLAAHWKHVVSYKDSVTESGYAPHTDVCIKFDIHISISCPCHSCWLSVAALYNGVAYCCLNQKSISTFPSHNTKFYDQEWLCNVYWRLYQNRFPHFRISIICPRDLFG